MFGVVTFGSASFDVLLKIEKKDLQLISERASLFPRRVDFPLGAKIRASKMETFVGGGGTNAAFTFSLQGLKTAFVGKVGDDDFGDTVLRKKLKKSNIALFVKKDKQHFTNYSVILSFPGGERTIFVFRGASSFLRQKDIPLSKIKSRYFYFAPLAGITKNIFPPLARFAKKNNIKIAINPSPEQISFFRKHPYFLSFVDVVFLNNEEASLLSGKRNKMLTIKFLRKRINKGGIVVITAGAEDAYVANGSDIYQVTPPPVFVQDKTGAGDAFASAFIAGLLKKNSIEYATKLAIANAISCIQKFGAKNGLLRGEKVSLYSKIKVNKRKLS